MSNYDLICLYTERKLSKESLFKLFQRTIWMNQYLRVPINPFVKLVIRFWCFLYTNFVGYNKTRLRFPCYDQVKKITVVGLDVALARTKTQYLNELAGS
jgi:hypothetical protein